tara:strand:+ start:447 stop:1133 length:687 start_codon:yes stop_codon:yes gene_type:complete
MQTLVFEENNTPRSQHFDDIYYNIDGGLEEKHYVFIQGNDLPEKFEALQEDYNILELGFGTGLSFLLTALEFNKYNSKHKLHFTSTELYPLDYDNLNKTLVCWDKIYSTDLLQSFLAQYKTADLTKNINITLGNIELTILVGDARETLKKLELKQNSFYLDGFAPSKNPVMWGEEVFSQISRLAKPNATCATYAASRLVKDILTFAQFSFKKRKGFGKKRDMIVGVKS